MGYSMGDIQVFLSCSYGSFKRTSHDLETLWGPCAPGMVNLFLSPRSSWGLRGALPGSLELLGAPGCWSLPST